jgi:hypothetical protein
MARSDQEDNILSRSILSMVRNPCRFLRVADAHRGGKRFVVRADEKLTAFVELESATLSSIGATKPHPTFPNVVGWSK